MSNQSLVAEIKLSLDLAKAGELDLLSFKDSLRRHAHALEDVPSCLIKRIDDTIYNIEVAADLATDGSARPEAIHDILARVETLINRVHLEE